MRFSMNLTANASKLTARAHIFGLKHVACFALALMLLAAPALAAPVGQGDALTMTVPSGQPITFPEWGYLGKGKFQRRDFRYDDLNQRASYEGTLFGELDDDDLFFPAQTYPTMTVSQIAEADA